MANLNNKIPERVRDLEISQGKTELSIKNIEGDIKDIKNNHLHGIYKKLETIEKKMYQRPGWFLTALISILSICLTVIIAMVIA